MCAASPWLVEEVDSATVDELARDHVPNAEAVALNVDAIGDPHGETDEGHNWTLLSCARNVADVVPGAAIVLGTPVGRYLAKVLAWDVEVSSSDPMLILDLMPLTPRSVEEALARARPLAT